jgi:hypothetical protein
MNGIEVAVKFPKIKLKLRDKDLKKFAKEVALQAKVRVSFPFQSMFRPLFDIHFSRAPP